MKWKDRRASVNRPDKMEGEILEAFSASEHEISSAADNPFLHRRLLVGIEQERRRQASANDSWSLSLTVAMRALPGFAALTIALLVVTWFSGSAFDPSVRNTETRGADSMVASTEFSMISNDDLVSLMLGWKPADPRGEH